MKSYLEHRSKFENKTLSPSELTNQFIKNIQEQEDINAFITTCFDDALNQAKESDKRFEDGNPRSLEGMVIAIKDNISTKGIKTTCASKMLENFVPIYDASVIKSLKDAGAIIIGKTNMDEFAMGSSNENSAFGNVLNPINKEYVPGGSSGGSAAAVAGQMCHTSLGSETGGSVRQPAAFTNTVGYKPSYGRISRFGLVAFGSSFDQIGIFSHNVEDCSLVADVITGKDDNDSTTIQEASINSFNNLDIDLSNKCVGIVEGEDLDHLDDESRSIYLSSIEKLKEAGYKLKTIKFPFSKTWIPIYYIISTAEASSNLSRFDGMRYGFRAEEKEGEDLITKTRSEGFGDEVKRRILLGTYVLSAGHYDQFYQRALKARRLVFENYKRLFEEVDFVFIPTTPTPAFKIGEKAKNPLAMYQSDFYTASANIAGIPAINIPVTTSSSGLPIGLQVQTNNFEDELLFAASKQFQEVISNNA